MCVHVPTDRDTSYRNAGGLKLKLLCVLQRALEPALVDFLQCRLVEANVHIVVTT